MQGDDLYHSAYFSPKQLSGRQLARPVSRVRIPRSDSSCAAQSSCVGTGFLLNYALTVVPLPSRLSSRSVPPWRFAIASAAVSPSPAPWSMSEMPKPCR